MGGSYTVVPATPQHLPAIPAIERSAASLFGEGFPPELREHTTPQSVLLAAQSEGRLWVAIAPDGELVGCVCVVLEGAGVHLGELDVLPAHGRRGIGTALVKTAECWARSHGYSEITLTTYRDLPFNAPFYARLGFSIVPESEWDMGLRRLFEEEAGLESERAKRVVMRMLLDTA